VRRVALIAVLGSSLAFCLAFTLLPAWLGVRADESPWTWGVIGFVGLTLLTNLFAFGYVRKERR